MTTTPLSAARQERSNTNVMNKSGLQPAHRPNSSTHFIRHNVFQCSCRFGDRRLRRSGDVRGSSRAKPVSVRWTWFDQFRMILECIVALRKWRKESATPDEEEATA